MSLKGVLQGKLGKVTDMIVPRLFSTWDDVQQRLDDINCSLATRAIPESRRSVVSGLNLQQKAGKAGQKVAGIQGNEKPHMPVEKK
jgi:hypothetical protein